MTETTEKSNQTNVKVLNESPVVSFSPVVLKVPGRQVDLQLKVSMPATGNDLPILLLSHGHGNSNFLSSLHGYGPLADFYAANGFVVIQPTHQDSKMLKLDPNGPEGALFWKSRAQDMHVIIDHLDRIETTVPGLNGRMNKHTIAALGHSLGGHTVAMLAGMPVTDPVNGEVVNLAEPRVKAFVMIGVPGNGADLAGQASEHYPVLKSTSFSNMTVPALIVNGDQDKSAMFSARDNWRADAYYSSPGPKCLLTVFGAHHIFGGISGYDAAEASDENPTMVAFVRETILAYLRTQLDPGDSNWKDTEKALKNDPAAKGSVECK